MAEFIFIIVHEGLHRVSSSCYPNAEQAQLVGEACAAALELKGATIITEELPDAIIS